MSKKAKDTLNMILTVGALCSALADAGNVVPKAVHGYLTIGAIVAAVLSKSPLFNNEQDNKNG